MKQFRKQYKLGIVDGIKNFEKFLISHECSPRICSKNMILCDLTESIINDLYDTSLHESVNFISRLCSPTQLTEKRFVLELLFTNHGENMDILNSPVYRLINEPDIELEAKSAFYIHAKRPRLVPYQMNCYFAFTNNEEYLSMLSLYECDNFTFWVHETE